jgi:hypothetical protein
MGEIASCQTYVTGVSDEFHRCVIGVSHVRLASLPSTLPPCI